MNKKPSISGRISQFLQKESRRNNSINEAVNQIQNGQASVAEIIIPPSREKEVNIEEPKNFGTTTSVSDISGGLVDGANRGDLLYWNPSSGDGGAWDVLSAPTSSGSIIYWSPSGWQFLEPPTGETLSVLGSNGGTPYWIPTESCEEE